LDSGYIRNYKRVPSFKQTALVKTV